MQVLFSGNVSRCIGVALLCLSLHAQALPDASPDDPLARGIAYRQQGQLHRSIEALQAARLAATSPQDRARAGGELGIALLKVRNLPAAEALLREAHAYFGGTVRARYAYYLGNLQIALGRVEEARALYREARELAPGDREILFGSALNLAGMAPEAERRLLLQDLSRRLMQQADDPESARYHLNLGHHVLQSKAPDVETAYRHLDAARRLGEAKADAHLLAEAYDALAQLYESQGRTEEALTLAGRGLAQASGLDPVAAADLLIGLEWRQARLLKAAGQESQALAAYRRAVGRVESVRQDIPIEYENGRSSFRETLEPIYLGYADLALRQLDRGRSDADTKATQLQQVVQTIELIRQTELQDFLGDRCSVDAVEGGEHIPAGTALLYPLVLPDRVELLLRSPDGIERRTIPVAGTDFRKAAEEFSETLRNGLPNPLPRARQINDWLLKPFEETLKTLRTHSLVVVPDAALRLVPVSALFDGERFAIEKYAVSMVTGLSMTNTAPPKGSRAAALVVGISEPGPVVEKLDRDNIAQILEPNARKPVVRGMGNGDRLRALHAEALLRPSAEIPKSQRMDRIRSSLALPGVKDEVSTLGSLLDGARLLDSDFTVGRFREEAESGDYRIVHIASHGFFGGSAESSFIMAYDDLLTINNLQSLLHAERFQKTPIELLSLSACETADGNDRAPLGISGAAIKARAKSVVGTLWPVEDSAAKLLMQKLYRGMTVEGYSKSEALRRAQLELLRNPASSAPFYWAPFVLIGNWL